jgi:hypothetical protein
MSSIRNDIRSPNESKGEEVPITEQDLEFPEAWRPKAGEYLIGTVTSLDERDGEYGSYPIVTVVTDDGKRLAFHAFHTVARGELARLRPKVGDEIGIKYHGRDAERGYERYTMRVDRPGAEVDWDRHAAETEGELASAAPIDPVAPF